MSVCLCVCVCVQMCMRDTNDQCVTGIGLS